MMSKWMLSRDDSSDLGFVVSCFVSQAISRVELGEWAESVIRDCDDYPPFIIDLLDFNDPIFHIYRLFGFVPSWSADESQLKAIEGIAVKRGVKRFEQGVPDEVLLLHLLANPEIEERFRRTFPFIKF